MALQRDGGLIGQLSGRVGPNVFSHNRYGSYVRAGTIPVTSTTPAAMQAKNILTNVSQAWRGLTDAQRLAWRTFAEVTPHWNRIGQRVTLTGQAAYVGINSRLQQIGVASLVTPPLATPPPGLASLTFDADIGAGDFEIDWTATPLPTGVRLWILAAVVDRPSINYVQNLLRFVGTSAAAATSPFDPQSLIEARFGALVVGQRVTLIVHTFSQSSGLLGAPLRIDSTVTST